jgi:4,5-dihydroxyphthalate decarboxylase
MPNVNLSLSCGWYDRTAPILDGRVTAEGIRFSLRPTLRPGSPLGNPEADVYECSLTALILEVQKGNDSVLGLPIFPRRRFFHQSIVMRSGSDIRGFQDFGGKKIGLRWYHYALGVWLRGYLSDNFALNQDCAEWFIENSSVTPMHASPPVQITPVPKGKTLVGMLLDGELDLLAHEDSHRILLEHPMLVRLFPDFKSRETTYFKETRFFPINHLLVIKRDILHQVPWVATKIVDAFERAKLLSLDALQADMTIVSSPWMASLLEEQYAALKRDLFAYGLTVNRDELNAYLRYFYQQGLMSKWLAVEDLFEPML